VPTVNFNYRGRSVSSPSRPPQANPALEMYRGRPVQQPPPTQQPTFAQPRPGQGFTDFQRDYWAPDRPNVLLDMLSRDYHAPDRDAVLAQYRNMPDSQMWPHGKPGQQQQPSNTNSSFDWNRWDQLTSQYPGTVQGLSDLVGAHPELGVNIVGGSRGDIQLPGGDIWDVILAAGEGGRGWQRLQNPGSGGGGSAPGGDVMSAYQAQFNDPATQALERFLQQRFQQLQQPAYTGTEAEVLRTQALEPIERDRQAARNRALERVSQAGYLPSSGVALDLQNQVDAGYDRTRAQAQGQLAYNQIGEERDRQREAQALLTLLYDLPNRSLQQALAVLGMGPAPESVFNSAMGLYNVGQQQRNQGMQWWQQIGALLPYLSQGGDRR
jgi:hypothetical protein